MDTDSVFASIQSNRLLAADLFDGLTEQQWRSPSLCAGWTVRDVAGHMLTLHEVGMAAFALRIVRARGSIDRAMDGAARDLARRPVEELVAGLRSSAGSRATPPGFGPLAPLTDSCVHLRDVARPLGLDADVPPADWQLVLGFLVSPAARRSFVPRGRLDGLQLTASDQDWNSGSGAPVRGPGEALALAILGRRVALDDLTGAGVATLADRIG